MAVSLSSRFARLAPLRALLVPLFVTVGCAEPPDASEEPAEVVADDDGLRAVALSTMQADAPPSYDVYAEGDAFVGHNPRLDLAVHFDADGVVLRSTQGDVLGLRTASVGRLDAPREPGEAVPTAVDNRVGYARTGLDEWYVNGPLGLQQGFTIHERPEGEDALAVEVELLGTTRAELSEDGRCVDIETARGQSLAYCDLFALDAEGVPLEAHIELEGERITLVVDDTDAAYPVTIDPFVWIRRAELKPNDTEANDWYGAAVAVDGNRAVVGAYLDDGEGNQYGAQGVAYGFRRTEHGWVATYAYEAPAETGAQCGRSVAISGEHVAVGCPGSDEAGVDAGKVLLFLAGASGTDTVTAGDAAPGDAFGYAVALSGTTLVAGAYADDLGAWTDTGSAYVFVRQDDYPFDWIQEAKLVANDYAPSDFLGASVALSGNNAIVGAYRDDNPKGVNAGAAYVFHRSGTTWSQKNKLVGSQSGPSDWFGYSVDIDGGRAIVGSPYDGANNGGAAYVFGTNLLQAWVEQARIVGSDTTTNDNFGLAVALDQDTAVVSARLDDWGSVTDAGSAYVFLRSGGAWSQQAKLTAGDAATGDYLLAVAVSGDEVIAGATRADGVTGVNAGAAYTFERAGAVWSVSRALTAALGSFGHAVSISGDTAVVGTSARQGKPGVYVYDRLGGTWQQSAALVGSDELDELGDVNMGFSVSIDGDTIAVGEPGDDTGSPHGHVEIFLRYDGAWFSQQLLSEPEEADWYGRDVAVSGDRLAVGSPYAEPSGRVYLYARTLTGWIPEATLTTAAGGHGFGSSVALSGTRLVAGAIHTNVGGMDNAGTAHVFANVDGDWIEAQALQASDPDAFAYFGSSTAISGETILVGSKRGAYVYVRANDQWTLQAKLAIDEPTDSTYGVSVALDGELAVVGVAGPDDADEGSGQVFSRSGTTWTKVATLAPVAGDDYRQYGQSVALDGVTAIVGGYRQDGIGVANIHERVYLPFPF